MTGALAPSSGEHALPDALLSVLVVEDREDDAELLARLLEEAGLHFTWRRVDRENDFVRALSDRPDVIISDYNMPGFDGLRALHLHQEPGGHAPFILVSGVLGEDVAVEAIRSGATDYLLKDRLARLGPAVLRALEEKRLRERERLADERLRALVEHANDVAAVIDDQGLFDFVSPSIRRIMGHDPASLVGSRALDAILELVHPDDADLVAGALTRVVEKRQTAHFEARVRHGDGGYRWLAVRLAHLIHEPAVRGVVCNIADVTAYRSIQAELKHRALHDSLTGLPNRALLHDRLDQALGRARSSSRPLAVLFVDLDRFKQVNDSLGHMTGDQLLVKVADRMRRGMREADTVCRFGGDEFVVVVENLSVLEPGTVGDRIRAVLHDPFRIGDVEVFVTASIGMAISERGVDDHDTLLRDADAAMYQAKERGRDRCELYEPTLHVRASRRLDLVNALHQALANEEFDLHYQPIVGLADGHLMGFEALLRLRNPDRGSISPGEFIPIAEETGLIVSVGSWVLVKAAIQAHDWVSQFGSCVSVNVSPVQLAKPDLVEEVNRALVQADLDPKHLCLEITEGALLQDSDTALAVLNDLKALGVRLAVDDFGTGYSALSYLKHLPVDILKIDHAFVAGLGTDPGDEAIVTGVMEMAGSLGFDIVAEGVETDSQRQWLVARECRYVQGFLFGRPAPADHWTPAAVAAVGGREAAPAAGTGWSGRQSGPTAGGARRAT